jgi:MoaA/NifB/PqqE/SkfB family radical SAM enzyme
MAKNKIKLFPVKDIQLNFDKYISGIKKTVGGRFTFSIIDIDFISILATLKLHSDGDLYKDRDLIRFLGLICEYTFIGPEQIVVDPFHRCNTNCVHCWNHAPTVDPGKEWKELMLDYGFFKKLIDDAANLKVDLMVFGGAGEPLMHPNIIEIFEYATKKGIKIIVSTNAINLTKKMTDRLMRCNLYEIICSLPAASDEVYWKVNPMHDKIKTFEKILSNLRYYSEQKKRSKNNAILSMYHVIHNLNYHEIPEMARMDVNLGVDIARFSIVRLQREFMHLKLTKEQMESIKNDIGDVEKYFIGKPIALRNNIHFQIDNFIPETGEWSGKILEKWGCKLGWFFSLILGSGQMSMCCHVREVENLKSPNTSFADTWLSKDYNDFRVKAKYIKDFKDTEFKNKVKLYDDKCENCDNHVTLITIEEKLKKYGLERFLSY